MKISTFDPIAYHFVEIEHAHSSRGGDEIRIWETHPTPEGIIGRYRLVYYIDIDKWDLYESMFRNDDPEEFELYHGRIPDDDFGFQLFKNMELELPVIQREIKIDSIF
jgi:hypothetical protein